MNLLTKFNEDQTVNVASRVNNAPPLGSHEKYPAPGGHFFEATKTLFKLIQDIIGPNLLTKFHDDRKINVTSRVLTRKNAPPPWWPYIIRMNILTEFHEDRTINVASRLENAPLFGSHVFQAKVTIFELIQYIFGTNLLTKFHEDRKIIVPLNHIKAISEKNAAPLGSHVFQANVTIFELIQDIIETNPLTTFHEDWTINVASTELTRQMLTPHNAQRTMDKRRSQKLTMSTLCSIGTSPRRPGLILRFRSLVGGLRYGQYAHLRGTNILVNQIGKTAPPTGGHVFQRIGTTFELNQDIIKTNILTKLHEDWACNVTSTVFTSFGLGRDFIGTKLLTKFHEDGTRNVAYRVFTSKCLRTDGRTYDGQRPVTKAHLSNQRIQAFRNDFQTC
ncbi:hypothetical protein DPMN_018263 [Dreissena polymorpha]|uniref:Uncharacterized protein n=1 Tax=Dreissena polymorpha TaxID=45954 RepID=A0A9D4S848_DREPO|nr:hypothetical protein DPMN_018263 [Dreissena polymorpha]